MTRLLLESRLHNESCFLTLTYSEKNVPKSGSLIKRDYQLFLKRLRLAIHPTKCRYYLVGEYGGVSGRPHYHVVLFGYGCGVRPGLLRFDGRVGSFTEQEEVLLQSWGKGNIHVASVTEASLQYACKHLTKGLKNEVVDDGCPVRVPEFARMSLRPGIGGDAVDAFEEAFSSTAAGALALHVLGGDAPSRVRIEGKTLPIGRYLRSRLRDRLGLDECSAGESRKRLSLERAERNIVMGPVKLKQARAVDGAKAQFRADVQKSRSKL